MGLLKVFSSVPGRVLCAESHQELACLRVFHHLMASDIGHEDVVVFVDAQAVRKSEVATAPGSKVSAALVEDDQRVGFRAALENIDVARRVGGDGGDPAYFQPSGRVS